MNSAETKITNKRSSNMKDQEKINYLEKEREDDVKELLRPKEEMDKLKAENESLKWANKAVRETIKQIESAQNIGASITRIQDKLNECQNILFPLRGVLTLFDFYFRNDDEVQAGAEFSEEHYLGLSEIARKAEEMIDLVQSNIATTNDSLGKLKN